MNLISGMDNSVLLAIIIIVGGSLVILWTIINYLNNKISSQNNAQHRQAINDPYNNVGEEEECPICTERIKYKVEFDCRHNFCGLCTGRLIQHNRNNLKCPLCRSQIRLINYDNFSKTIETQEFYDQIVKYNYVNVNGYNFIVSYLTDFPYLLSHGLQSIFTSFTNFIIFFILVIFVLYYFFNPMDLIPDALGLIGYTDDVSFFGAMLIWIIEVYFRSFRNRVNSDYEQVVSQ